MNDNNSIPTKAIKDLKFRIENIINAVSKISELKDELNDNKQLADHFSRFQTQVIHYHTTHPTLLADKDLFAFGVNILIGAKSIQDFISNEFGKAKFNNIIQSIDASAEKLRNSLDNFRALPLPQIYQPSPLPISDQHVSDFRSQHDYQDLVNEIKIIKSETKLFSKTVQEQHLRLDDLNKTGQSLYSNITSTLKDVDDLYETTLENLRIKQQSVEDLLGKISGSAVAQSFETSADTERKSSDWLRYGSITCMVGILFIVGYSFYETTTDNLKIQNSVLRLIFAAFMSIPAAYLARESAKHRRQEYAHRQTSLNLRAIDPYIASLPKEEQDRLKTKMAKSIFVNHEFDYIDKDSYPINLQELLTFALKKLEKEKKEKRKIKEELKKGDKGEK